MIMREQLKEKEIALMNAILTLVNDKGYQGSSMAKIAKMAGISPGTIYLYFENKQDMLDKLYLFIKEEMCRSAFEDLAPDGDVETEFRKIWYNIAEYKTSHTEEAVFLANCDISPIISEETKAEALLFLRPFLDLCERGQSQGIIRPDSLHLIYAFSINPLSYLISAQRSRNLKLTQKRIDEVYDMVWNAIIINKQ